MRHGARASGPIRRRPRRATSGRSLIDPALNEAGALEQDSLDPLAAFADEFHHPEDAAGRRLTYLCGHSLGLQPRSTEQYVAQELADWRRRAAAGHHSAMRPWIGYHEHASADLAALVGSGESEVVAMNSLTVNLHLMMVSFFRPKGERTRVLIEKSAFPSDRYAIVSQLAYHGLRAEQHLIEVQPRAGERHLRTEDLVERLEREGSRLALALLPGVQYLTGQAFDLAPLIEAARRTGAQVGLDLAHAVGNIPLRMHDWNADFAVWCSYKYLNAGPGAIGGCFVHDRHAVRRDLPRFAGWWGHDASTRFEMPAQFEPTAGAQGWQISNPSVLSAAPLLASLEVFRRAGLARLREKSIALTSFLHRLIEARLSESVEIITPAEPSMRGCQLSLRIARPATEARRCHERLSAAGVLCDWREPDVLRMAPAPLYNSYHEVFRAVEALAHAVGA